MAGLSKLLKYDLRANLKIYLLVWPCIIAFALLSRLALAADWHGRAATILTATTVTLFILAVIAACAFALIISIIRFYSGLLRDEGYLMFTLPVRPWQLLLSKFITAILTIAVTAVISFFSVILVFDGVDGLLTLLKDLLTRMDFPSGLTLTLILLLLFFSMCAGILQIYLSCSIGHLFRSKRILWSVLVYYGISMALEVVVMIVSIGILGSQTMDLLSAQSPNVLLGIVAGFEALLCALYFFLSERILRNHLNLE